MSKLNIAGSNMTVELRDNTTLYAEANTGNKQWVAVLTDTHPTYNYDREFVAYQKPKTSNRDSGTATVEDGTVIERVRYTHSGKNRKDRFYQLVDGEAHKIDEADVEAAIDGDIIPDVEPETHECETCGDEFDSEHGLAIHDGIKHSDDSEGAEEGQPDAVAATDSPTVLADGGVEDESESEFEVEEGDRFKITRRERRRVNATATTTDDQTAYPDGKDWDETTTIYTVETITDRGESDSLFDVSGTEVTLIAEDGDDECWYSLRQLKEYLDADGGIESKDEIFDYETEIEALDEDNDIVTDGGQDIRTRNEVQHTEDEVRTYSADGTLYAYREGDEHVVVSRGREARDKWTKRVPAERTAVVTGEQLWTIPDNWEKRLAINGAGSSRYAVYRIPETGVDVCVTVPSKNHLVDAWYGIRSVGGLSVTYDDSCDWDALDDCVEVVRDIDEVSDEVVDALAELSRRSDSFEREFEAEVNEFAEEALFETRTPGTPSIEGWTVDPWGDIFVVESLVGEFLDIGGETLEGVMMDLRNENIIPSYPTVKVDVADRAGLPEGFDDFALTEAGCSPPEAMDYKMTEILGLSQTEWADDYRRKTQGSISGNVGEARKKLEA